MQECDFIVSAPYVLPVAPHNQVLENHAVAVRNGQIAEVGPRGAIDAAFNPARRLDLAHHILMPGLVNAHGHAAMTLLRGAGEDQSLQAWLQETIWPLEGRLMNPDFVNLGTELAMAEMLSSGTTTCSDMYFFPEVVARQAVQAGMRVQVAVPVIEMPNAWSQSVSEGLHKALALHDHYRHQELVKIAFGPHSAYTLAEEDLQKVAMYANELDAGIQIHLHENAAEVSEAVQQQGCSWVMHLNEIGLLGPQLQAVHMTTLTAEEIDVVAASGARVVHCPSSNLKLASGYCPVNQLRQAGLCVGLGTDGAASNNRLDMFKEMHLAALLEKHATADPTCAAAPDMLRMATLDSARALGMDHLIGSLEAGKAADMISVDIHHAGMLPLYDPFAALVHGNCGEAVDHVFVNGETLLSNGQLTRIDSPALTEAVTIWQQQQADGARGTG